MFKWGRFSEKGLDSIEASDARLNIWQGAVRSSKTVCSIVRWIDYCATGPPGSYLMIGKTERTLARNVLAPIREIVGSKIFKYNRGTGEAVLGDRHIYIAGANDERSVGKIQGLTAAGAYGDELSLWPESIFTMMLSRMSVMGAKMFGTTNPDSPYHWLKEKYLARTDLDLKQWQFEIEDNPNLDPAYIAALKKEYTGLWFKRYILGLWVLAEGAVYDMWDDSTHVVDQKDLPQKFDRHLVGIDYATGNPTAFLLLGQLGDKVYVVGEYYWDSLKTGRQKTDAEYSKDLQGFLAGITGARPPILIDPSAASFIVQLRRDGVQGVRHADNEVLDGIRNVATMLSGGRLYVCRQRCPNLLKEFASYVWDPAAQKRGEDKPMKQNDHALDALRYAVHTVFGRPALKAVKSLY